MTPESTMVTTRSAELHVLTAGDGPPVVLLHGFPELSYSWRYQIPALAEAGYRVIVPDQRGYGRSSCPPAVEDYDIHCLTGDVCDVLDHFGHETAVVVGHDWGSMVAWQSALLHPTRVSAVCGMSVPFTPRLPMSPTQLWGQFFGDRFFYILYFQEPGVADAELAADPRTTMAKILWSASGPAMASGEFAGLGGLPKEGTGFLTGMSLPPGGTSTWLSEAELDHYVAEFTRSGFTGGLNWYRNFDRNWETTAHLDGATVTQPSAFIGGKLDPVAQIADREAMEQHLADLRLYAMIDGAGHWNQQEQPDATNAALLEFLNCL